MLKRLLPLTVLSLGLVFLAGCGLLPSSAGAAKPIQITSADNGKTFNIALDQQAAVMLAGNPTTGYAWEAAPPSSDSVTAVGEPQYKTDPNAGGKAGAGGMYTFTYQGAAVGSAKLSFAYRRPWERDTPPAQTFDVTLNVVAK
ncbi:MAG: protease inhibitor I42 family protein [Anaerolineae bacterium]